MKHLTYKKKTNKINIELATSLFSFRMQFQLRLFSLFSHSIAFFFSNYSCLTFLSVDICTAYVRIFYSLLSLSYFSQFLYWTQNTLIFFVLFLWFHKQTERSTVFHICLHLQYSKQNEKKKRTHNMFREQIQ